ncbi:MAG: TetR/AcrR family transcriptional regulator [bacterium]
MGNTRRPRKEREYQQRRSDILRTALTLFSEKGFHGTSMQEIAEKSEFAVGTLYNFFANKDEIYQTLITETAGRFHSSLMKALQARTGELNRLKACVEAKIRVFLENLDYVRIYFAETQGATFHIKTGLDTEIRTRYEDYLQKLAGVLQSGIRRKIFRGQNPYLLALAFDSISTAFLVEHMENPDRHPFDAYTVMDIFLNGVSAVKGNKT